MAGRYFITGAQLGVITSYLDGHHDVVALKNLVDKIMDNQFIGDMTIIDKQPFLSMFPIEIRPELLWFIIEMEKILKQNDHKTHWSKCTFKYLHSRLGDEYEELAESLSIGEDPSIISKEATDVANLAMMIADNSRRIPK